MKYMFIVSFMGLLAACNAPGNETKTNESETIIVTNDTVITATADTTKPDNNLLSCTQAGPLKFGSSYAVIEKQFGSENLMQDSLFNEGDFSAVVTTIYKNSPKELQVVWEERKQPFTTMLDVRISNPASVYKFENGMGVGTTLREMVRLNGNKPIKFYGFSWDYGGMITYDQKGSLKEALDCFGGRLDYAGTNSKWMGDSEFNSGMKGMPLDEIKLEEIILTVAEPQP